MQLSRLWTTTPVSGMEDEDLRLAIVFSIGFYWYVVRPSRPTGVGVGVVQYPWRGRIAVALAAVLFAILIAPVRARSIPIQYAPTVWQTEQGLPSNSVNATVQDHDGYLWVATNAGLARFDGVRFRIFGGDDFPSLRSSRFQSLYAGVSGELWIGTRNGGLIRLHDGTVTTYLEHDGLPSTNILSIREDAGGKLWVNTISGVVCCAGDRLQAYPTYRGKAVTEFFSQERDGSMWFRSGTDVVRFGADGSLATLAGGSMVREAGDGSVWVAFQHQHRLVRYHGGVFSDVPLPAGGARQFAGADPRQGVAMAGDPRQAVLAMASDTDGALLLLMPAGLVRAVDGRLSPPETLPLPANIGDVPKVLSLIVDREGNRWVGTVGRGLFRFRRAPLTAYGKDEGLSDSPFRTVFQDREGRMWLGGDDGLYWSDGNQFHQVPGLTEIGTIAQTNDGDLWFGGSGAVYRWRSAVLARFRIESPAVFQILQDREGKLWIIAPTYEQKWRLYQFHDGRFEQIYPDVVNMAEDREGGLWLASAFPPALRYVLGGKTVLYYDERHGIPPTGVHSFNQDPSGALWFSTTTGLYRLRDGKVRAITAKNGLTTEVTSILDDGKGNLWLPSDRGIFRLPLQELNDIADGKISSIPPITYGVAEGMKTSECNGGVPGAWKARDGRLWFPTMRGVVAINPNAVSGPPPVVLEEAWANDVKLARNGQTSVKAGSNTFDFTFTALNLSAPERQRFKYRLEPFERDWVDAGTRRTAHYTNMPPGEYSFQVIAANSCGVWNDQGAGVRFLLQPHFYQTNWFRALCLAGFLALLWAAYRLRVGQLEAQERKFREAVETMPALAFLALPDGNRTFVNRGWVEYTGMTVELASGSGWQAAVHPDDLKRITDKWRAVAAKAEPLEYEARLRRGADGAYRWFQTRAAPLRDKRGKLLKWCGVATDIEDRKRADKERERLRQLETDLAHINRVSMMGELTASIAHEVNQPLSGVVSNGSACLRWLAGDGPNLEEAREAARRIVRDGKRAGEVIARVRALAKRAATPSERLDLNETIREVLVLVGDEAKRKSVNIRTQFADDLSPISGDRVQLQQVMLNLVMNAIEAMSSVEGRPRELVITTRNLDADQVQVTVKDSGPGIDLNTLDRIFDPFCTTKPGGMGMGLSISRSIVQAHGGRLWAAVKDGPGTIFHFSLPRYHEEEPNAAV